MYKGSTYVLCIPILQYVVVVYEGATFNVCSDHAQYNHVLMKFVNQTRK